MDYKASSGYIKKRKAYNMDKSFKQHFSKRAMIVDSPDEQVHDYVSKKMTLYLNKALVKIERNSKATGGNKQYQTLFPAISLMEQSMLASVLEQAEPEDLAGMNLMYE